MPASDLTKLVALAQHGDPAAWQSLVDECRPRLLGLVARKAPGEVLGSVGKDDLVQDILLSMYRGLPRARFDSPRAFGAWFMRVARHTLVDSVRRAMRKKHGLVSPADQAASVLFDELAGEGTSPSRTFERGEARLCLRRILDRLPARDRSALVLVHIHRFKTAEAAAILGISGVALRKRLERALDLCRDIVQSASFDGWRESSARPAV
jgi:RNA polymerase sigma-70 factor (ECF subfamily)